MRTFPLISMPLLAPLLFVGACATPTSEDMPPDILTKPAMHELRYDEVPQWDLVSLLGLGDALKKAYETKNYSGIYGVDSPVVFDDLDYADFSEVDGKLRVHRTRNREDLMAITFSSCNGISGTYEREGDAWRYVGLSQTTIACERAVRDETGKQVILGTPMVADDWFIKIAPDVTSYKVSAEGHTLALLGASGETLGTFSRRESVQ